MKEILIELLQTLFYILQPVILTILSIVAIRIVNVARKFWTGKLDNLLTQQEKDKLSMAEGLLYGNIKNCVQYVYQVYVNDKKKDNNFGVTEQNEAFEMALTTILKTMPTEAKNILKDNYGEHLNEYIGMLIEAYISREKSYKQ